MSGTALGMLLAGIVAYVTPGPGVAVWTWAPGENATAHAVYLSTDAGPATLAAIVLMPATEVTLSIPVGAIARVHVEPLGSQGLNAPGPPSDVSEPVPFISTADLDGDEAVGMADYGRLRAAFGHFLCPGAPGRPYIEQMTPCL